MSLPPAELEQLVRDELRVPVAELVRRLVPELVAEALNGAASTSADATRGTARAETKLCNLCDVSKPLFEFDPGRRQCKACRRDAVKRRARERRTTPADEEPHQAPRQVHEGRPGEHRRMTDEFFRERRRELIEQAPVTTEERDGRTFCRPSYRVRIRAVTVAGDSPRSPAKLRVLQ